MADFEFTTEEREVIDTLLKDYEANLKTVSVFLTTTNQEAAKLHNDKLRRILVSAIEATINDGWEQAE